MFILKLIVIICILFPVLVVAKPHQIIISATKPFPARVSVLSTTTAIFTVTNVAKMVLTVIDRSRFPPKSGLSILSTNCSKPINPGEFCTIELQLKAPRKPQIISVRLKESAQSYSKIVDTVKYPIVILVSSSALKHILVAAGKDFNNDKPLIVSSDGSETWNITELETEGHFNSVSCAQGYDNALCVAVGGNNNLVNPFLVVTTDSGSNWHIKDIPALPPQSKFKSVSCTGIGKNVICAAVGVTNEHYPLIAVSTDGAETWRLKTLPDLPQKEDSFYSLVSTSCTGEGLGAVCIAAGYVSTYYHFIRPLLVVSYDGGNTWVSAHATPSNYTGYFNATSCTGYGDTAICSASGLGDNHITPNNDPYLLAVSNDGGKTWSNKYDQNNSTTPEYEIASCSGTGSNAICATAGSRSNINGEYIAYSIDGGNNWDSISGISASFYGIKCLGDNTKPFCVAVGKHTNGRLMVSVSNNSLRRWNNITFPATGRLNGISCFGDGIQATCFAVGYIDPYNPIILVSDDSGINWKVKKFSDFPITGIFNTVASI